jgi:hypothetical protein
VSDVMQERYGTASPRRRVVLRVVTGLLAIVFLGWLAWVVIFHSDPAIEAELKAYDVIDAHQVDVRLATRFRDDDVEGSCLVRAFALDHTVVGERNITVAELRAADGDWISITTFSRANAVETVRCTER